MTNSNRFKKAHEKAKQIRRFCTDYRTAFRLSLIEVYEEEREIAELACFRLFDAETKKEAAQVKAAPAESFTREAGRNDEGFLCLVADLEGRGILEKETQTLWDLMQ